MHSASHRFDVPVGDRVQLEGPAQGVGDGLERAVVRRRADPAADRDSRDLGVVDRAPDCRDDGLGLVADDLDVGDRAARGERERASRLELVSCVCPLRISSPTVTIAVSPVAFGTDPA